MRTRAQPHFGGIDTLLTADFMACFYFYSHLLQRLLPAWQLSVQLQSPPFPDGNMLHAAPRYKPPLFRVAAAEISKKKVSSESDLPLFQNAT